MIEFKVGDGKGHGYLSIPKKSRGGVLVLHAWWGLNDFFKGFADKLAAEGYTAFAPDLREGKVARTVDEAKQLMKNENEELVQNTVLAGLDYLHKHPMVKSHKLGVVGFSMGAALALWVSTKKPSEVAAVVTFYGAWPMDYSDSKASYLGHFAPDDEWEPMDGVRQLEETLRQAGRPVTFHVYPGAKHWFIEDNQPAAYDPSAARLAWTRTLEFLNGTL
jgi:carboxymethylenebutenolidase